MTNKTLTNLVLAGALVMGGVGCYAYHPEYHFNGKIGDEQVKFNESDNLTCDNFLILTVIKADQSKVVYGDVTGEDLK